MYFFNGPNKHASSTTDTTSQPFMVHIAKVVSITDDTDSGRIFAKITGIDGGLEDTDPKLIAVPLLSKFIGIYPKVGESVFIFIQDVSRLHGDRFWVGPIISQPQFLNEDQHLYTSRSSFKSGGLVSPAQAPSSLPETNGVYPKTNEISYQGRDNTDLIFRSRQVIIRAGKFNYDTPSNAIPKFNTKNPTYFKLAYHIPIAKTADNVTNGSVAAMVAEKLLLLTFNGRKNNFSEYKLTEPNVEISEKTILELLSKAEPAVYGYVLVEFLNLIKTFVTNHCHPYHGLPPVSEQSVKNVLTFNLEKLLAKNIRMV